MTDRLDDFELIVHIGTPKTGSSSIQKTLCTNSSLLKESGVAYLGLMCEGSPEKLYTWQKAGGWPEFAALDKQLAQEQLQDTLTRSMQGFRREGFRRAILSNETIFGNAPLIIPVLKNLESLGAKVKIIVYIRRHDAYIRSAYLQWGIKHKNYRGPVKNFVEWHKGHRAVFYGGLKRWMEVPWSDMTVRNYDVCNDVVVDFLSYYGLNSKQIVLTRENDTPNATALVLWAIYNSQFDNAVLPVHLQRLLEQAGVLAKAPVHCDFTSLFPSREDIDAVRNESVQDRKRINEVLRQFSQPELDISPLEHREMAVTQNQINAALLMMVKNLSDQVARLNREIQTMTKAISKNDQAR